MPDTPLIPADPFAVVGVDLGLKGLKDFAVVNNGDRLPASQFFRKSQRRLRRAQRVLARREMRSNRRRKAKLAVSKLHATTADHRKDFIHQFTTKLVRKYEGICIEDLSIKGLAKTKLAKSVLDAALGMFRRQLEYKTVWNRRHLAVIDRWFPSSKACHVCGCVNEELTLADRVWLCCCGTLHDRDLNASWNIRSEGLKLIVLAGQAQTLNAQGLGVRLPHMEAVGDELRIPRL
jgi:putative transposase